MRQVLQHLNSYCLFFVNATQNISQTNIARSSGTVFIVTVGYDWDSFQKALRKFKLWSNDIVFMTFQNYSFITSIPKYYDRLTTSQEHGIQLAREYLEIADRAGFHYFEDIPFANEFAQDIAI